MWIKNNKTADYIHRCNKRPFCEEKIIGNYEHYNHGKYRECLPCYIQGKTYILFTLPTKK